MSTDISRPQVFSMHHCSALLDRLSQGVLTACQQSGAKCGVLPCKVSINPPPNPEAGDLSFGVGELMPAFKGQSPQYVSELLASALDALKLDPVQSVFAAGRYVNLRILPGFLAAAAVKDLLPNKYFATQTKVASETTHPQHCLIEFSSPNTNKPQHLGHVRNNLLGDCCSRLLSLQGHNVTKVNLVNDRGIHICKSMLAYNKYGNGDTPGDGQSLNSQKGDHFVGKYYVEFEKHFQEEWKSWLVSDAGVSSFKKWQTEPKGFEVKQKIRNMEEKAKQEQDPKLKEKYTQNIPDLFENFKKSFKDYYMANVSSIGLNCNQMLKEWEAAAESNAPGDCSTYQLWSKMNSWVLDGFWATYKRMGIAFDHVDYESLTYQLGKTLCEEGLAAGLMHKTESGAVAISYDKLPGLKLKGEKVLLRPNGTSVYMTQDLGTALMRWNKFSAENMFYVVAEEQREHFKTLFAILALLCPEMKDRLHHLSYGMVNLTTGRMKSREGTVVDADTLMDDMQKLAAQQTRQKWPELKEEEVLERAEKIGLAALKFYILSSPPEATMLYDPEASIKFEGKTGPYALYSYVRTQSILRKCGTTSHEVLNAAGADLECLGCLASPEERAILRCLFLFNTNLHAAAERLDPSKVCSSVFALSQAFNKFFKDKENHPIKECSDASVQQARLLLTVAVGAALSNGLNLLGIETLDTM